MQFFLTFEVNQTMFEAKNAFNFNLNSQSVENSQWIDNGLRHLVQTIQFDAEIITQ